MASGHGNTYLRDAVLTASPEQLHLMLYDGALRFCRSAREAIERGDFECSCEHLLRAQQIVVELESGLRPEINADLCDQMRSLYQFVHGRLVSANMSRDLVMLDEAVRVLEHQRETWRLLIDKLREQPAARSDAAMPPSPPNKRVASTRLHDASAEQSTISFHA